MDLSAYRAKPAEQERVASLLRLLPERGERALDIGARDGFIAQLMADRFEEVVALDLQRPDVDHPKVRPVAGDATHLEFSTGHFDAVLCAEVLEHVPTASLPVVCSEMLRVCRGTVVIGVPNRQDLRYGKTTCNNCGLTNPPWGHVNRFDEARLLDLFRPAYPREVQFVGQTLERTNTVSSALLDFAGNPFGTWNQEEPCVHCGARLGRPTERGFPQRVATKIAVTLQVLQSKFTRPRGNWLHAAFEHPNPDAHESHAGVHRA